jgi:hypothetical protein
MNAEEMLDATAELVSGHRSKDYGDKYTNHTRIAKLWAMWLNERTRTWAIEGDDEPAEVEITAYDVAIMMLLVKVARLMHSPGHQDSHIDIAGYASISEEIANGE